MDDLQIDTGAEASSDVIIETGADAQAADVADDLGAGDEVPKIEWDKIPDEHPMVKALNSIKIKESMQRKEIAQFKETNQSLLAELNTLKAQSQKQPMQPQPNGLVAPVRENFESQSDYLDADLEYTLDLLKKGIQPPEKSPQADEMTAEERAQQIIEEREIIQEITNFKTEALKFSQENFPDALNFFNNPENSDIKNLLESNVGLIFYTMDKYGNSYQGVLHDVLINDGADVLINGSEMDIAIALNEANHRVTSRLQNKQTQLPKPIGPLKGTGRQPSDLDMDDREYFRQLQKSL